MRAKSWTKEDERTLRKLYANSNWLSLYEIADILERTTNAIASKAKRLGITKNNIAGRSAIES